MDKGCGDFHRLRAYSFLTYREKGGLLVNSAPEALRTLSVRTTFSNNNKNY